MHYIIKNKEIISSSNFPMKQDNIESVELNISEKHIELLNDGAEIEILEEGKYKVKKGKKYSEKVIQRKKQEKIDSLRKLKNKANELRVDYLTAEMLPDSEIKTKTLNKLKGFTMKISTEYMKQIADYETQYSEDPLELIL